MFFNLKKKIMCRSLEKRNLEKPFDYAYAENYTLEGVNDPLVNNSYYFSAHDEHCSFYARLGRRITQEETWFVFYLDGKRYALQQNVFPVGASPLSVEKSGEGWSLSFKGKVNEADEVVFTGRFTSVRKPIDFTSDVPPVRMATGIANEKWSKDYFSGLQQVSGQCHYEQEGLLEGDLTLNGRSLTFRLPCVRDHSFGKRDWNYMNNHLWLMAVSPEVQFNYSLVSYPAITALEVGHCRNGEALHYMLEADLDFREIGTGEVPRSLSFHVRLDNGKRIPVKAQVLDGIAYPFQDGQYILHEHIASFEIEGKMCRGIFEIGFNRDPERYFNQRNLQTLQR